MLLATQGWPRLTRTPHIHTGGVDISTLKPHQAIGAGHNRGQGVECADERSQLILQVEEACKGEGRCVQAIDWLQGAPAFGREAPCQDQETCQQQNETMLEAEVDAP